MGMMAAANLASSTVASANADTISVHSVRTRSKSSRPRGIADAACIAAVLPVPTVIAVALSIAFLRASHRREAPLAAMYAPPVH